MSRGDLMVEKGAARLEELSRKAAAKGGFVANLADELADDAAFLRKLKPSLIKARAQGKAPINRAAQEPPRAPSAPRDSASRPPKRRRPKRRRKAGGGPNPFLVAGVALAAGIALAKVIDWRGHAHPRDN